MALTIGKLVTSEFSPRTDPETGAQIVRLTGGRCVCHHVYPSMRSTTSDGMFLLYFRETNGRRQLFAMNLDTGNSLQLTSGAAVDAYHAAFSADDRHIFYLQRSEIWCVDARDLLRTRAYKPEAGWVVRDFDLSADDRFMVVLEFAEEMANVTLESCDWSTFAFDSLAAPRCRIVYVDRATGARRTVVEEKCWLGRPSIRPGDPDTILYCHEGPYDMIDARMWLVQSDGAGKRCCREQDANTVLTSEFWLPDGSAVVYLHWKAAGERAEEVRAIDPVTLEERTVCDCPALAHVACSPDGRYVVGDALSSDVPVHLRTEALWTCEQQRCADDDCIYLIDLACGEGICVCHHGASYLSKYGTVLDSEPHPIFTRDGRSIIYVSDAEGIPCIYRVDVARFLWEQEAQADEAFSYGLSSTF